MSTISSWVGSRRDALVIVQKDAKKMVKVIKGSFMAVMGKFLGSFDGRLCYQPWSGISSPAQYESRGFLFQTCDCICAGTTEPHTKASYLHSVAGIQVSFNLPSQPFAKGLSKYSRTNSQRNKYA